MVELGRLMDESANAPAGGYPLEPSAEQMRAMAEDAVSHIIAFVLGLEGAPASDLEDAGAVAERLRASAPGTGAPFREVLDELVEGAGKAVDTAAPGFLGYIPGGGLYTAAIGAYLGFALNRFVGLGYLAPPLAQIEWTVARWFLDLFELPTGARGILTSGGSIANLTALFTARWNMLPPDFLSGTLYVSEQTHHSVRKAARIVGFPPEAVRPVPVDGQLRAKVGALEELVASDRRRGLQPFCIVGNAGTTSTGSVDPLGSLARVARENRLWFHVDAAYGGFFQLTERGRQALSGITEADSITLDPHKGMFLPYGTGALLVRDGRKLRDAHTEEEPEGYLQDRPSADVVESPSDYSPELSRDFRALRVWLPVKLHGLEAFRAALAEKLELASRVYEELSTMPGFEVPWPPELSTVAFRYRFGGADEDAANRELLTRVNATRRVFLTSTNVGGRVFLRICILSHRTHRPVVEECLAIIRRAAAELEG